MHPLEILLLFFSASYAAFVLWAWAGWHRNTLTTASVEIPEIKITVIVPVRNEEPVMESLLNGILLQEFPKELLELIVVDDHSEDRTREVVRKWIIRNKSIRCRLIELSEEFPHLMYKKNAITKAIEFCQGELVITTDADTIRGPKWISAFVNYYIQQKPDMICGPVMIDAEKNLFDRSQSLELLGLAGITAGAINHGIPIMCNGANLCFRKDVFLEVSGYDAQFNSISGDDTQLMMKIANRPGGKVSFISNMDAAVYTKANDSVRKLFNQRSRWASKIPLHMSGFTRMVAFVAFSFHLLLIIGAISLVHMVDPKIFLTVVGLKVSAELMLLSATATWYRKQSMLWMYFPTQLIYPAYIVFAAVLSLFGSRTWKGREVRV